MGKTVETDKKVTTEVEKRRKLPLLYLSGFRATSRNQTGSIYVKYEKEFLRRSKITHRCMNFCYVYPEAFAYKPNVYDIYKLSIKMGVKIMMDSSAFTFHNWIRNRSGKVGKKEITDEQTSALRKNVIKTYLKFIEEDRDKWDFFIGFDYEPKLKVVLKMQEYFTKNGAGDAVPVYHGDVGVEGFQILLDEGYKFLCLSGSVKGMKTYTESMRRLEKLFKIAEPYDVKIHGLGISGFAKMISLPWWSVDSSSWMKNTAYGSITWPDPEKFVIRKFHVSHIASGDRNSYNRLAPSQQRVLEDFVDSLGFDMDKVRTDNFERFCLNAYVYSHLEDFFQGVESTKTEWIGWDLGL